MLGIDGAGGAGKSTFAARIAAELEAGGSSVQIVKLDDFYKPSEQRLPQPEAEALIGSDFDWQRLRAQVLMPLSKGLPASYQRYDWENDQLAEWLEVSNQGIILVEGVYSTRYELRPLYDLTFWVYCSRSIRLDRGIARDGEAKREFWEKYWMPAEDRFIELEEPHKRAHMIVDGSGASDTISLRCDLNGLFTARDH